MGFKIVNPLSDFCSSGWNRGEHVCTLTNSNTVINALIFVRTYCHYRCVNPNHNHTVIRNRVLFLFEFFSGEDE